MNFLKFFIYNPVINIYLSQEKFKKGKVLKKSGKTTTTTCSTYDFSGLK